MVIYYILLVLSTFAPLQGRPNHNVKLEQCLFPYKGPENHGKDVTIIWCYKPDSVEDLHTWITTIAEQEKSDLAIVTDLQISEVNPNIILQTGLDFLPNLKTLALVDLQNDVVQENTFAALSRLEGMYIVSSKTKFDDKALAGLSNLKKLAISGDATFTLQSLLKGVPALRYFRADSNYVLQTLEEGDFEGVPNLTELRFFETGASRIKPRAFQNLQKLQTLSIGSNSQLRALDDEVLTNLHSLKVLELARNEIENIQKSQFVGLKKVNDIDLSYNTISVIPEDAFGDLTVLEYLDLSNNSINQIENKAFKNLVSLRKLRLTGNNLKELPDDILPEDTKLEELYLDGNHITEIDSLRKKLKNLRVLKL